ncbi:hypothetical protein ACGFZU_07340, partial [Streptomyces tendae]
MESLTTRLRGRLDQAVQSLATTPVDLAEDGTYGIRCGADAWVTLAPGPSGTITSPDQARCTCLLSPRCLHRTAVLAASPVANAIPPREPGPSPDRDSSAGLDSDVDSSVGPGLDVDSSVGPGLDVDSSVGPGLDVDSSVGPGLDRDSSVGPGLDVDSSVGPGPDRDSSAGPGLDVD